MKFNSSSGFSLSELISVVVLIGLVALGAVGVLSNAAPWAKKTMKHNNAAEATRQIQNIRAAGGEEALALTFGALLPSSGTSVSAAPIIDALTVGVYVNGLGPFKLGGGMTASSYVTKAGTSGWDTVITFDEARTDLAP